MQINLSGESDLHATTDIVTLFLSSDAPKALPSSVDKALAEAIQEVLEQE